MDKIIKHVRVKEFMAYHTAYNDFIMKYYHGKLKGILCLGIKVYFFLCTQSKHITNKYVSKSKLMSLIFNENPPWKTHRRRGDGRSRERSKRRKCLNIAYRRAYTCVNIWWESSLTLSCHRKSLSSASYISFIIFIIIIIIIIMIWRRQRRWEIEFHCLFLIFSSFMSLTMIPFTSFQAIEYIKNICLRWH